ncbi:hypothetical protein ACWA7J_21175 [Leptothrix sp. BB-4]
MRQQFDAQVRSPATALPVLAALLAALASPLAAQADDAIDRSTPLRLSSQPGSLRLDGQGWVARLDLGGEADRRAARSLRAGWQLLGDYYFGTSPGNGGLAGNGLRATGGWVGLTAATPGPRPVLLGAREMPLWSQVRDPGTSTYLGLGYSLGQERSGWGVKADVGLLSTRDGSGGLRLNRSGASIEDATVGDLRWLPMLQVGVSYAF